MSQRSREGHGHHSTDHFSREAKNYRNPFSGAQNIHFSLPGQWSPFLIPMYKVHSDSATSSLVHPSRLCLCYYSSFLISLPGVTLSPSSHYPIVAWPISGGWGEDVPCKTVHSTFPSRTWLRCTFHSALHDLDLPVFPPCSVCFLFLEDAKIICPSVILCLLFPLSGCFSVPLPDTYKADHCFS